MSGKIFIIIPAFNVGPYMADCLCSLTRQSYTQWQAVIVDDGSTDDTPRIINAFVQSDPRFTLLTHHTNKGQSAARNTALNYIGTQTGEYVTFLDADDYIDYDYLHTLVQHINHYDVVQVGYKRFTDEGLIISACAPKHFYRFTSACMRLYKKDFIRQVGSFPENMIYEDVIFSLQVWAHKPQYTILPYTGYNYRLNPTSTTAEHNRKAQQHLYHAIMHTKASLWLKIYTILRLKWHFTYE